MASRLVQKMALKDGKAQCKMMLVVLDSPMGRIEISGCETGIHELSLQKDAVPPNGTKEASVTCELCEGPEEMTEPLKQCTAWLSAYFCEPRITEKLPIPSFHHPVFEQASFTRQVLWTLLRDVKFGETVSYKQLADLAGNSKAARAVGGAMRSNPVPHHPESHTDPYFHAKSCTSLSFMEWIPAASSDCRNKEKKLI
ncbi:methylated-DNA--protein-cysteine methyltransferase isoform X4 [Alligator mississippiensis]|uniref:methylated-DNA--protein-cysteine methyltransferase isoform X4 n=1 Tax=Alligator mississippiensis TaxID=8496 RepID=UPI000907172C|nr:methylated-DNA--protein-cysteine methyltransferase isoform X4 [Alligator mississippiensis]